MKTKTIVGKNAIEFDRAVNAFNESFKVKFTQTHITHNVSGKVVDFVAILYYEE